MNVVCRISGKCKERVAKIQVLTKKFMKHWISVILWIVAIGCVYVIMCAGLHVLPHIGSRDNAENVNNVLLNLSYSYLAGGIFYLFTSTLPRYQKSRRFRPFIDEKEKHIIEKLISCMSCVFTENDKKALGLNLSSVVNLFSQTDLRSSCKSHQICDDMTIFDLLVSQRDNKKESIEEIFEYKEYMTDDEICRLEQIRDSYYFGVLGLYSDEHFNEPNNRKSLAKFLWEVSVLAVGLRPNKSMI